MKKFKTQNPRFKTQDSKSKYQNSKLKIGVLVSGNGSNLQAIIDRIRDGKLDASVEIVVSDNEHAYAVERARHSNIPVQTVDYKSYPKREAAEAYIVKMLHQYNVDLIVLAGYMKLMTKKFINAFPLKIMNIHPALLPAFPGINVIQKAIDYGVKFTGCTVHFIDEGTDTGPIIIQAVVPVMDNDTEETLANRIHEKEHTIYPIAIQLFAENRLTVKGRRVFVEGYTYSEQEPFINPCNQQR
jgi:phosphoribosylglycinamide formyltransferase-1